MATGKITLDEGVTTNTATNTITEDAVTKHIPRSVINNSSGTEIGTASNPIQVSVANTGANATAVKVDGSAVTQPVSAASLPLPTGASTAAKQPALGTAGSASADVITVQGIASMTALKVDGSAVTQPVSGTVTATIAAGATTIAKAEDVASANADVGVPAMAVQKATPANTAGTDGDYEMLQMSAGRLWTSATIDAALPAGTNAIGKLAANSGVDIGDVDVTSVVPGSGATNLGKAEDAAHSSGDVGVMALGVRLDSAASLAGTDGDYAPFQLDSSGALRVTGGGGGTEYVVNAVAPADPTGTTMVMERDDQLSTLTEVEGDWTQARATSKGALWVAIADSSGDPITSFGGGTQYTEDAAAAANPVGTALNLVRDDARGGSLTTTDGDNVAARGTNAGELYVKHVDTIAVTQSGTWDEVGINDSGNSITVDNPQLSVVGGGTEATALRVTIASDSTGVLSVDDNGGSLTVDNGGTFAVQGTCVGTVADDATTPGNPVMIGGKAVETDGTDPTSVSAEDDVAIARTDRNRRLLVNTAHPNLWSANDNQSTAQTNTVLKAAPGANLSLYITDIVISNGATAGDIRIVEDPAGTPVIKIPKLYLAANGGASKNFSTPIRITANKAIGYTSTTVTTHSILVNGYIAP